MQVVSKSKFATMINRSPGAISQYIAAGKLHGPALTGEGRHAQINVEVAMQQLGEALSLGQQLAQPHPILGGQRPSGSVVEDSASPTDQARLLKAKADREELALQVDQAKAAELQGHWMVTTAAEAEWSRQLAGLVQSFETWLVTVAAADCANAAAAGAGPKEFGKMLKDGFRDLRQRLADAAAQSHEPHPQCDDDDDEEDLS